MLVVSAIKPTGEGSYVTYMMHWVLIVRLTCLIETGNRSIAKSVLLDRGFYFLF